MDGARGRGRARGIEREAHTMRRLLEKFKSRESCLRVFPDSRFNDRRVAVAYLFANPFSAEDLKLESYFGLINGTGHDTHTHTQEMDEPAS